jgi:hypothetical protein
VFQPIPAVSVKLQFTVYSLQFCWGGLSLPGAALCYVPGVWVRESHVCVAHLLGLQVYAGNLTLKNMFHTCGSLFDSSFGKYLSYLQTDWSFLVLFS